ncbi:GNAT family N-acetyltransferase ['Paenibacillus yunnanensis' Narsing Rao et al. 2020]|uniref:GNAT family N-acetyltransferase n=1 Tax=Paenibacillus tengchongensis TaxID=2608684 RepID=UPI00124C569B|nr:GNAT family protein [Paenibacillus tengchongensis]
MHIRTPLLELRSTTESDLDFVLAAEQHADNRLYVGQWSRERHAAALRDKDIRHQIMVNEHGQAAGYVILTGFGSPDLSICIMRIVIQQKGRGLGSALLASLTEWIFTHTQAHRIWLDVKDHNARARHVYERAGFLAEGTLRECVKTEHGFDSLVIMSMLRREYEKRCSI